MRHYGGGSLFSRQGGTFPPTSARQQPRGASPTDATLIVGSLPVAGTFYAPSPTVSEGGDRLTSLRSEPFRPALTLHTPLDPASSSGASGGGSSRDPRRLQPGSPPTGSDLPPTAEPPTLYATAVHDITFG